MKETEKRTKGSYGDGRRRVEVKLLDPTVTSTGVYSVKEGDQVPRTNVSRQSSLWRVGDHEDREGWVGSGKRRGDVSGNLPLSGFDPSTVNRTNRRGLFPRHPTPP